MEKRSEEPQQLTLSLGIIRHLLGADSRDDGGDEPSNMDDLLKLEGCAVMVASIC